MTRPVSPVRTAWRYSAAPLGRFGGSQLVEELTVQRLASADVQRCCVVGRACASEFRPFLRAGQPKHGARRYGRLSPRPPRRAHRPGHRCRCVTRPVLGRRSAHAAARAAWGHQAGRRAALLRTCPRRHPPACAECSGSSTQPSGQPCTEIATLGATLAPRSRTPASRSESASGSGFPTLPYPRPLPLGVGREPHAQLKGSDDRKTRHRSADSATTRAKIHCPARLGARVGCIAGLEASVLEAGRHRADQLGPMDPAAPREQRHVERRVTHGRPAEPHETPRSPSRCHDWLGPAAGASRGPPGVMGRSTRRGKGRPMHSGFGSRSPVGPAFTRRPVRASPDR
jgi:hypothetical protein